MRHVSRMANRTDTDKAETTVQEVARAVKCCGWKLQVRAVAGLQHDRVRARVVTKRGKFDAYSDSVADAIMQAIGLAKDAN